MDESCPWVWQREDFTNEPPIFSYHSSCLYPKSHKSGCNEQDYSNACYAHSAGVSVARTGKCSGGLEEDDNEDFVPPPPEGEETDPTNTTKCRHNDHCGEENEFCLLDMGMCDRKSGSGVCASIDDMCTFEHNPVW